MTRFGLVFVALCVAQVTSDGLTILDIDQFLAKTQGVLRGKDMKNLQLDDLKYPFEFRLVDKTLKGEFTAEGGEMSDLTSVHRPYGGVVSMSTDTEDKKVMTIPFNIVPLEVSYKTYSFKYQSINSQGKLKMVRTGSSGTISLVVFHENSKCVYAVGVSLDNLGGISTELTGQKIPDQFVPFINSWVFYNFHIKKKVVVETNIMDAVNKVLSEDPTVCTKLFENKK